MNEPNSQSGYSSQNSSYSPYNNNPMPQTGNYQVKCPRCSCIVSTQICSYCGLNLSTIYPQLPAPTQPMQYPPAPPYQQPGGYYTSPQMQTPKKKPWLIVLVCVMVVVSFVLIPILTGMKTYRVLHDRLNEPTPYLYEDYTASSDEYYFPGGYSDTEHGKLTVGMSYARISAIIGGDGELVNSGDTIKSETFYTYAWPNETDPYTLLYITFTNDASTDIMIADEWYDGYDEY